MRAYKFRIYPTPNQEKCFKQVLFSCFKLYNTAITHRREAYRIAKKSISRIDQQKELPKLKQDFPEYANIHSQVVQNVLHRVDFAFKSFFKRAKSKTGKAGFPRYKSFDRYDSFCFPQFGFSVTGNKLNLTKIGSIRIKLHRQVLGKVKTCTIKREGVKWYCVFTSDVEYHIEKRIVSNSVGIDLGLTDFAVLSNGVEIKNPKYLKRSDNRLKSIQSKYSKGKSKKLRKQLTWIHRKIANQRKDFQHKLSRKLVNNYDLIAYEDLKIKQMVEDNTYNLQKSIHDASWGKFIFMLNYKAEEAGSTVIKVNPKGTSQKCSRCGQVVKKSMYERSHMCSCGFETTRDHNAALNIERLGINLVSQQTSEA